MELTKDTLEAFGPRLMDLNILSFSPAMSSLLLEVRESILGALEGGKATDEECEVLNVYKDSLLIVALLSHSHQGAVIDKLASIVQRAEASKESNDMEDQS